MGLIDRGPATSVSGEINLVRKSGARCDILAMGDRSLRSVRGNDVAMIFQEHMSSLNPVHSIGTQIVEALRQHRDIDACSAREKARELLAELGIANTNQCLESYSHQLSGGMRQRVMIAIALSGDPRILIADEPTTALDVTIQAQIIELFQQLQQRTRMSMIFITHNLGVVAEIAQRAIVMYAGEVTESLSVPTLFGRARMPYTRALLRSLPRLDRKSSAKLAAIPGAPPNLSSELCGCAFHPRCEHAQQGRCDAEHPLLDTVENGHVVRCHRWRELEAVA
jgi:oligopeptide/dipeptide ABC transporter ATP-binding protein